MRNKLLLAFVVLMAAFVVLAGCGSKDSPKSLAKQTFDLSIQAMENAFDTEKSVQIAEKNAVVEAKVAALSPKDKEAYDKELGWLSLKNMGKLLKTTGGVLNEASGKITDETGLNDADLKALKDATGQLKDALNSPELKDTLNQSKAELDALKKEMDVLKSPELKDSMDQLKKETDQLKKETDQLKKSTDALKGFGF